MADYLIMKAVEHAALPVKFKKQYPTLESLEAAGYWLQKKYDGCFGIATVREEFGASTMQSRTGEDYSTSCEHILAELAEALTEARGQGWHQAVFLGEVWHPDYSFPTISGKFRKRAPSDLLFVVNDILPDIHNSIVPYRLRYEELVAVLPELGFMDQWHCFVADTHFGHAWPDTAEELALRWQAEGGFDGAILRNPAAGYTVGTVKNGEIVKVKPTLTLDLRCTGVTAGTGKHAGKIGALTVLYKGEYVGVGTGLSDADRAQPDDWWVGQIVEVECMGVSTEGKLREPRLKGIRFDKTKADGE